MRVAVRHTDKTHPNHHWFAFEQGRILGFDHPITGENFSADEVTEALLVRARTQYPEDEGYEHRVEILHVTGTDDDGKEIGGWFPAGKSKLPRAGGGAPLVEHVLSVEQGQEASGETAAS